MAQKIDSFTGPYAFLSNFYPISVIYDGDLYPSVEHAYQAAKTEDLNKRWMIQQAPTAAQAKKLGRKLELRYDWDNIRLDVMEELLYQKFAPNTLLGNLLLGTKTAHLEEGNYWGDHYWGVCNGRGENHLGKLLMKIRKELA